MKVRPCAASPEHVLSRSVNQNLSPEGVDFGASADLRIVIRAF